MAFPIKNIIIYGYCTFLNLNHLCVNNSKNYLCNSIISSLNGSHLKIKIEDRDSMEAVTFQEEG